MGKGFGPRLASAPLAIVSMLLASHTAAAWDRVLVASPVAAPGDLVVQQVAQPDSSGFWAAGVAGTRAVLVRYDVDARLQGVHAAPRPGDSVLYDTYMQAMGLDTLPDGGALLTLLIGNPPHDFGFRCHLQRYDAAGALRWSIETGSVMSVGPTIAQCNALDVDAHGDVWLAGFDAPILQRVADDGSILASFDQGDAFAFHGDAADGGVYTLAAGAIAKYSKDGQPQWSTPLDGTASQFVTASDGNLIVFGKNGGGTLTAWGIAPSGELRWTRTFDGLQPAYIGSVAAATNGGAYASLIGQTVRTQVVAVTAAGAPAWAVPFEVNGGACSSPFYAPLAAAPDGGVSFLYDGGSSDCGVAPTLYRLHPDGTAAYTFPLAGEGYQYAGSTPRWLGDASTLLASDSSFIRVSAAGSALPAPPTRALVPGETAGVTQVLAADGGVYALTNDGLTYRHVLSRFGADGTLVWQVTREGYWGDPHVLVNDARACIAGLFYTTQNPAGTGSASCVTGSSGEGVWTAALPDPVYALLASRLLADNTVVLAYSNRHLRLGADGQLLHDIPLGFATDYIPIGRINAGGEALLAAAAPSGAVTAIGVDGNTIYGTEYFGNIVSRSPYAAVLDDDGTAVVILQAASLGNGGKTSLYAMRIDAAGNALWSTVIGPEVSVSDRPRTAVAQRDGVVHLSLEFPASNKLQIAALSRASGAQVWSTAPPMPESIAAAPNFGFSELALDVAGEHLLRVADAGNKFRFTTLSAATGAIQRDRFEACLADYCSPTAARIGTDSALRVLASAPDAARGVTPHTFILDAPFANPASIRIDQPGLDGAWYAPYEGGQGFTFDWIASASTVFMPWFTFAQSGINDPSGLAWYTLQGGGIAPGATSADLAIAVSNAGAFNSGSVPGRQVGTAHLSFSDCNSGTLYYQFDADTNGGAGGLISLIRLTPSTDPCVLADGSAAPAQNGNAPANGYDAKQSGSWYDPTTGGQGMELTIVPAGNGSAGLVFAPWFTFDPSGHSDDALNQHWFTLQGDLSAATNGKVTLPIYRIIGGSFDATPTSNFAQVGQATLTTQGCDVAQLDYAFDGSEVAHAFAGLTGSMHLARIGGCR